MKETNEVLKKRNGEIFCELWKRRLNIDVMSFPPTFVYRFSEIPIQTPMSYFVDIDKVIL